MGSFFHTRSSSSRLFLPVTHFTVPLQNNIFVEAAKMFPISCVIQEVSWYENTKSCHVCTTFANPSSILAHCSQSRCSLFATCSFIWCHPLCSAVICSSQFSSHLCTQACLPALPGSHSFARKCLFQDVGDKRSRHKQWRETKKKHIYYWRISWHVLPFDLSQKNQSINQ